VEQSIKKNPAFVAMWESAPPVPKASQTAPQTQPQPVTDLPVEDLPVDEPPMDDWNWSNMPVSLQETFSTQARAVNMTLAEFLYTVVDMIESRFRLALQKP
jgi:hypothetical protein